MPLFRGQAQVFPAYRYSFEDDFASRDGFKPGNAAEHRCFAAAAGTQQAADLAFLQRQRQVINNQLLAISLADVAYIEQRAHAGVHTYLSA